MIDVSVYFWLYVCVCVCACLCLHQLEYAGGGWPKPIDKRLCVPTRRECIVLMTDDSVFYPVMGNCNFENKLIRVTIIRRLQLVFYVN